MKALLDQQRSPRVWLRSAGVVLFSILSALGFLAYFTLRLTIVNLSDKPKTPAIFPGGAWLIVSLLCLIGSMVMMSSALPLYAGSSRWWRWFGRYVLALILATIVTAFVGLVEFWAIGALSSGVVQ
jgi:hypothetical protein